MSICDKDCFHCPYPDCINDQMDHEDYIEASKRDKALRSTPKSKKLAAQQKAYREANREKVAAQQKAYREANREKLAAQQKKIKELRKELGLSLRTAASILHVSAATVSNWERGLIPCSISKVIRNLRGAQT